MNITRLSNVHIIGQIGRREVSIRDGKIGDTPKPNGFQLTFDDALAFPGLINSHDHLDFNLFPRLGNHDYLNYKEWGLDIHRQNKDTITDVLRIPLNLRIRWGLYKNLLGGVTTVVHHGKKEAIPGDLISVHQDVHSLHSLSGERRWKWKLIDPRRKSQVAVMHIGEGTDQYAHEEIDTLLRWNVFGRSLIGIHGVAMDQKQAAGFRALVWCPDSNRFLLNKTAPIDRLMHHTRVILGTDSTVSASWNIWEHLRLAREQEMMTDEALFEAVTRLPANIWSLNDRGSLDQGQSADIVVAKRNPLAGDGIVPPSGQANDPAVKSNADWNSFYALNPRDILLVMHQGNVRMFDEELLGQLSDCGYRLNDFYPLRLGENIKFIQGDLPGLIKEVRGYYPSAWFPVS